MVCSLDEGVWTRVCHIHDHEQARTAGTRRLKRNIEQRKAQHRESLRFNGRPSEGRKALWETGDAKSFSNAKRLQHGDQSELQETTTVEGEQRSKSYEFTSVFFAFMSATSVGSNDGQSV